MPIQQFPDAEFNLNPFEKDNKVAVPPGDVIKFFNPERVEHLIDNDLFVMDKIEYTYCIDRVNFKWGICDEDTARMQVSMENKVMANMCFVGHKKA